LFASLALMPEWYFAVAVLALLTVLGFWWTPLLWVAPLLVAALLMPIIQAMSSAARAIPKAGTGAHVRGWRVYGLTSLLHLIQPVARLRGRLLHGLSPWRVRGASSWVAPYRRGTTIWSEQWRAPEHWVRAVADSLREAGAVVVRGGDYDRWDLSVRAGLFGAARLLMAVEEHGRGRQLVRLRSWPRPSGFGLSVFLIFSVLSVAAALDRAMVAAIGLGVIAAALGGSMVRECGRAQGLLTRAAEALRPKDHS
jgi:hypothetical protein